MSMPCAGYGVGQTCRSVMRGLHGDGVTADLFTSRSDDPRTEPFPLHTFTPRLLSALPHRLTRYLSVPRLHDAYLQAVGDDQIAYLWPSVPIRIYEALNRRGIPILADAINTRMADAKPILDAAYASLGLPPTHRITEARIRDEDARLSLTSFIFSPSPSTDASLAAVLPAHQILRTSYGTGVPAAVPARPRKPAGAPVVFLFVGISGIRKGLHHLLQAWRDVPPNAHLRIVGQDRSELYALFSDVLAQGNVSVAGFRRNVQAEYDAADVFLLPSLEEGDPIVVYEAAANGLPIIASRVGAGRIGQETDAIHQCDTADADCLRTAIAAFAGSAEMRQDWSERASLAVRTYDWNRVAQRRHHLLSAAL